MKTLSDQQYESLKNLHLSNIIKKITQGGKTLTAREMQILDEARERGDVPESTGNGIKHPKRTKSDKSMRDIIVNEYDVSTRRAYKWIERLKPIHFTPSRGWDVDAALAEIKTRRTGSVSGIDPELKAREQELKVAMMEEQLKAESGQYFHIDDITEKFNQAFGMFNTALENFISYAASAYSDDEAVRQAEEIANRCRRDMQSMLDEFRKKTDGQT